MFVFVLSLTHSTRGERETLWRYYFLLFELLLRNCFQLSLDLLAKALIVNCLWALEKYSPFLWQIIMQIVAAVAFFLLLTHFLSLTHSSSPPLPPPTFVVS
jgi:hypothetical protein